MSIRGRVNPINNIIAQRNVGPQDKITRKYAAKTRQFIKGATKKVVAIVVRPLRSARSDGYFTLLF